MAGKVKTRAERMAKSIEDYGRIISELADWAEDANNQDIFGSHVQSIEEDIRRAKRRIESMKHIYGETVFEEAS